MNCNIKDYALLYLKSALISTFLGFGFHQKQWNNNELSVFSPATELNVFSPLYTPFGHTKLIKTIVLLFIYLPLGNLNFWVIKRWFSTENQIGKVETKGKGKQDWKTELLQNHLHSRPWDNYTWMLFSKDFQVSEFITSHNFYQTILRLSFLSDDFNHFKMTYVNWATFLGSLGADNYFWGMVISHLGVWTEKVESPSWYSDKTAWNL